MKNSMQALMLMAAMSGMMTGTAMAQTTTAPQHNGFGAKMLQAGLHSYQSDTDKHACKGQNDCKGKGGCKSGDNGCKGQNSCKGKGGCATDGSKPPSMV